MPTKKSPGGSAFPYYYKNGELFGVHFGSFFDDEEGLLALMKAEEAFIIEQNYPLPYWADLCQSKLTDPVLTEFIHSMDRLRRYIPKLAIVGCSFIDKWRIKRLEKRLGIVLPAPVRFFSDPEVAKTWLVSERYDE